MFRQVPSEESIRYIKSADLAELSSLYRKLIIKIGYANNHIWFNSSCKKQRVFPNYTYIKSNTSSREGRLAINTARAKWRDLTLRSWYTARGNLSIHLKVVHSEITFKLHPVEFDILDNEIRSESQHKSHQQYITQNKKLQNLMKEKELRNNTVQTNSSSSEHKFYKRFENLTETIFDEEEIATLSKGVNYAPPLKINKKILEDLAADTEAAIHDKPIHLKTMCAYQLKQDQGKEINCSGPPVYNYFESTIIKNIKAKLLENNLIACKADKGNTITILTKSDYNNKIIDFIKESKALPLAKDPTPIFKAKVTECIKNCKNLVEGPKWKYIPMNPSAPILYGLPKLHKVNIPIRPICSYISAPAYHLCELFNRVFIKQTEFISPHSIKHSLDLVNKISNFNIPPYSKLVSFDVSSLFTSVPIDLLKLRIFELIDTKVENIIHRQELKSIFNVCIKQNYFCYDNTYYTFSDGLPMGSPLSPLLAEVFMSWFEEKIISSQNPYLNNIKFWYRYVDDVLCLWSGTDRQLDCFLNWLNKQYNTIKFTMEKESDLSINYLDVTITRIGNTFSFSIYRKPTYSDAIIPMSSNHPLNIKLSTFHSAIERLINIPMTVDNYRKELNTILQLATNNGYDIKTILKLVNKKTRTQILKSIFPQEQKPKKTWRRLRYIGKTSKKISKIISKYSDINIGFYNNSTIKKLVFNNKGKSDLLSKPGVYKIGCSDCNSIYIGQTGRNFKIRTKEHLKLTTQVQTAMGHHLITENHNSSIENLNILHIQTKGKKLDALEALEIRKAIHNNQNILNDQTDLKYSPLTDPTLFNNING